MTVSPDLDARFRTAAAAEGLLDAGYDVIDSPVGPLLVAASPRGLCRISFGPDPEGTIDILARHSEDGIVLVGLPDELEKDLR